MSLKEYQQRYGSASGAAVSTSSKSKYKSVKVEVDGHKFDSKKEHKRYIELKAMMQRNEIQELCCQVKFELQPKVKLLGEQRTKPALRYFADFTYIKNGVLIVEDVKSAMTRKLAAYRNKKHLMKTVHGLDITEV